jgi:GT2 family glycosyltransferase
MLRRCLDHIRRARLDCVHEVVIVDQSARPATPEELGALDPGLLRYAWHPGRGLARARNRALRMARGEIIAFTDDDCLVTPEWPEAIARAFAASPAPDAVYGRVLAHEEPGRPIRYEHFVTPFGRIAYATRPPDEVCSGLIDHREPAVYTRPVMPIEHVGAGNNMAFRRTVFERHGLFIEQLGAGTPMHAGEDIELHIRLMRAGLALRYDPSVLVYHDAWRTPAERAALDDGYTTGGLAVHVAFALQGEPLSREYLRYRFGSARREAADTLAQGASGTAERKPANFYLNRARAMFAGIAGGALLALRRGQAVPRLDPHT